MKEPTMTNNEMKHQTLHQIIELVQRIDEKIKILTALDYDSSASGCLDLHDQLSALRIASADLDDAIERSLVIVDCGSVEPKN